MTMALRPSSPVKSRGWAVWGTCSWPSARVGIHPMWCARSKKHADAGCLLLDCSAETGGDSRRWYILPLSCHRPARSASRRYTSRWAISCVVPWSVVSSSLHSLSLRERAGVRVPSVSSKPLTLTLSQGEREKKRIQQHGKPVRALSASPTPHCAGGGRHHVRRLPMGHGAAGFYGSAGADF